MKKKNFRPGKEMNPTRLHSIAAVTTAMEEGEAERGVTNNTMSPCIVYQLQKRERREE